MMGKKEVVAELIADWSLHRYYLSPDYEILYTGIPTSTPTTLRLCWSTDIFRRSKVEVKTTPQILWTEDQ